MTINVHDFREYVVAPSCALCAELAAVPAPKFIEDLIVATAAQETAIGRWLHQGGAGDAVSIYQFEPASLDSLMKDYIIPAKDNRFAKLLIASRVGVSVPAVDEVKWNLRFATVMARLYYYRVPQGLPLTTSFQTLWEYYKKYWNTDLGSATEASFANALKAYTDLPHS